MKTSLLAVLALAGILVFAAAPASAQERTLFFVVDAEVAANLAQDLQRFMDDVAADTGAQTLLLPAPASAAELRQALREAWLHDKLWGAFFIGDIPYVYRQIEGVVTELQPTDSYYQALDCPYVETETPGIVMSQAWFTVMTRCRRSIWTSRIQPAAVSGEARLARLREYFDKNHRLRNDPDHYDDSMVLQAATPRETKKDFAQIADTLFTDHPLYKRNQVRVIQQLDAEEQKQSFISALQENVEFLSLNVHGSPSSIQFQSAASSAHANMSLAEFADLHPGAKVLQFLSCAVGRPGGASIADQVLFNSDTLLVEAAYTIILVSDDAFEQMARGLMRSLGHGLSFADAYTNASPWGAIYYFGDPTVRLEPPPAPAATPILKINGEIPGRPFQLAVDAGVVAGSGIARIPLELENTGSATLTLTTPTGQFQAMAQGLMRNGDAHVPGTSDFVFKMDPLESLDGFAGYRISIPPGQKRTLHMLFNPAADYGNDANMLYSGQLPLATNDPAVSQFLLLVQGTQLRVDEVPPLQHAAASDDSVTTAVFGGGVALGNWGNIVDAVPAGALADVGGLALVDARHVDSRGNFYIWIHIEGLGWYYQDTAGVIRLLGPDYVPAASSSVARARNVTLPQKQLVTILDDFSFAGRGLEGREIALVFGYSLDGSSLLYRNAEPIRFTVQ